MIDEDWGTDVMDFSHPPVNSSSYEEGHAPCRGKGRGAILYDNKDTCYPVGQNHSYNDRKTDDDQANYEDSVYNGDNEKSRYNDNNGSRFKGNRQQNNDRSHYRNNNSDNDGNNRKWQGNRERNDRQNGGHNNDEMRNGGNYQNDRNRPRRDRDDNNRDGNGGGYGRNRGNDHFNRNGSNDDRGRRRNSDNFKENNDEDEPKRREIYIPPEYPDDENSLFGNDVSMGINFDKYDDIEVKVSGENAPQPIKSFEEADLRIILLENIKKSNYKKPTPVQKYAIPAILSGRDLMACAQTGSGKTAAFIVPIMHTLLENPRDLQKTAYHCEPQVLIISPTRELTLQIHQQAKKFCLGSILRVEKVYGGTSTIHQSNKVLAGCHILVATPGRLLDFIGRGKIKLSSLRFLVLDEADRMLDMGFLPDIEKIVDHETMVSSEERQTLMFSATFPSEIQELAGRFLRNYLFLAVGIVGGACTDVQQNFYQASGQSQKRKLLKEILDTQNQIEGSIEGTLVFVEQKRHTDFIAAFLSENAFPTTSIHGDRLQREREEALNDFKQGKMSILVATAVAARGLDIKNVAHVINFDLPKMIDEYVHRIGRTGRVGNRGKATSFFDPNIDLPLTGHLIKILKQAGQPVPDWLASGGGGGSRTFAPGRAKAFGGEDIRDNNGAYGNTYDEVGYGTTVSAEPEEMW